MKQFSIRFFSVLAALFVILFFCAQVCIAQAVDTLASGNGSADQSSTAMIVIGFIIGLYELIARLIPTSKNWSLFGALGKLLELLVPNRQKK